MEENVFDLFDRFSGEVAAVASGPADNAEAITDLMTKTMAEACEGKSSFNHLETLFNQISLANGLHIAAAEAYRQHQTAKGDGLHEHAQLFLFYAIGTLQRLYDEAAAMASPKDGAVH